MKNLTLYRRIRAEIAAHDLTKYITVSPTKFRSYYPLVDLLAARYTPTVVRFVLRTLRPLSV